MVVVEGAASFSAWLEWLGSSSCFPLSWVWGILRVGGMKGSGVVAVVVKAWPSGFVGAMAAASSGYPFGVAEGLVAWLEPQVECSTCPICSLF